MFAKSLDVEAVFKIDKYVLVAFVVVEFTIVRLYIVDDADASNPTLVDVGVK